MPIYTVSRGSTALSTTNDLVTLVGATGRAYRLLYVVIGGLATASAANVVLMQRSTGGTTGGGGITPAPSEPSSPAAGFSAFTTWAAQPTLTANTVLHRFAVNANGGLHPVYFVPPMEVKWRGTEQVSFRSETGTSNVTITIVIEEI